MGVQGKYKNKDYYLIFPYAIKNDEGDLVYNTSEHAQANFKLTAGFNVLFVYHTHTAETNHNPGLSGDDLLVSDHFNVPNYALDIERDKIYLYDPNNARDVIGRNNNSKSSHMGYGHFVAPLYLDDNRINFDLLRN